MKAALSFPLSVWVLFLCLGTGSFAASQEPKEEAYRATLEIIQSTATRERADMFRRYGEAVSKLQTRLQEEGDLGNALKARAESEKVKTMELLDDEFPGIHPLREVLHRELRKIDNTKQEKLNEVHAKYIAQLKEHVVALTKAGSLDEASRLDKKRKEIETILILGEEEVAKSDITISSSGKVTLPPPPLQPTGNLEDGETLFGKRIISGGSHRVKEEIQIGRRKKNTEKEKGFLTIRERAEVIGGGFFANFGTFEIEVARLENVAIREELQATFSAKKSIFQNCSFAKGGGWGVAWFGSKWKFENCVFKGSFFTSWNNRNVGVKIQNCSFYQVRFPAFGLKEDALHESRHPWRTIENCLFVDCEVPVSVLLATHDCVFEGCRFVNDDIRENQAIYAQSDNPSGEVTVYVRGPALPDIPSPSPVFSFQIESAPTNFDAVGCLPFYVEKSNDVHFH